MKTMTRRVTAAAAAALLWALLGTVPASADSIGFDITVPNLGLTPYPSPYAHVDVNRTSTTDATITFTGLTTGAYTYFFGAVNAVDVNVNATTFTVGTPSVGTLTVDLTPDNVSEFGTLNLTLDNSDGYGNRFSTVNFGLTNTGGTWATASDVLLANDDGYRAAAHIFVTALSCEEACVTGFAGDPGLNPVPEPATLLLLGSSLAGLGFVGRKKLRR